MRFMMMLSLITGVLAIAFNPTANATILQQPEHVRESRAQSRINSTMDKIDRAMLRSRKDHDFVFFVVCLPEKQEEARETHSLWTKNNKLIQENRSPVYFLQGSDAKQFVEDTGNSRLPTTFSFRYGTLMHTRSGVMDVETRDAFLDIAFDPSVPKTYSADQFGHIYDLMLAEIKMGRNYDSADTAADILLITTGMMNLERFRASYPPEELSGVSTWYHQTLLGCSYLDIEDDSVRHVLEGVRQTSMQSWKDGEVPQVLGLWIDLSFFFKLEDEIIAWVDEGTESERAKEALYETFGDMVELLVKHERWDALANAIESPESIEEQLKGSQMIVEIYTDLDMPEDIEKEIVSQIRESALCHAALLQAGRIEDAWGVAKYIRAYMPQAQADAAICLAAHDLGVVTRAHLSIATKLDPSSYAHVHEIYQGYQTRAGVQTD